MPIVNNIIGHSRQCEQLVKDIEKDKVAHAYLFAGKRHLGKHTIARWFVEELITQNLNEKEKETAQKLIRKNVHPDVLTLDALWMDGTQTDWNSIAKTSNIPQQHRAKAKVKSDTIGIDDIRALQERLYETSQGSRTCCLIRSIERLHITAANALLKILEEPPPSVVFCFTTQALTALPATIVSRMRILRFAPVPQQELLPYLKKLSQEDQSLLLHIAQGSPGIILRCLDDPEKLRAYREAHNNALRLLESPSLLARFQQLLNAFGDKAETELFLQHVFLHLQEDLRSNKPNTVDEAERKLQHLFPLLHTLQSNTHKPLLAAHAALSTTSHSS